MLNNFNKGEVTRDEERKKRHVKRQTCIGIINSSDSFVLVGKNGDNVRFEGYALGDDMSKIIPVLESMIKQVKEKQEETEGGK